MEHRKAAAEALAAAMDELYHAGLLTPVGGNASVRLAGGDILITPSQIFKGALRAGDMVRVRPDGSWEAAPDRRPSVETAAHLAIYRARPEVGAVVHTHAPLTTALMVAGIAISPVTAEAALFTDLPRVPYHAPGAAEEVAAIAEAAAGGRPAILLERHGVITVGADLRQATDRALLLEHVARVVMAARLLGAQG